MVQTKKFRLDLYHRVAGFSFTQPPLRKRKEDIQTLLQAALKLSRKIVIKSDVKTAIEEYLWPGNIRQLLRFADLISVSNSGILKLEEFQSFIQNSSEVRESNVIEDHYYERIKEIGLSEFLDEFTLEVIKRSLRENSNSSTKAIAEIKTSKTTFYRHLDKDSNVKSPRLTEKAGVPYEIQ
jgi:transcriptional regulator with PAS, ATPase and Fis domain